ncbi:hypothetical protein CF645_37320 [Burkholderia pseudomallei]|nr:hypothetical protein CF645_37320 [Burkholderia pseudomallei]
MQYKDLRCYIHGLEQRGELRHVTQPVSPVLDIPELCDRVLRAGAPARSTRSQSSGMSRTGDTGWVTCRNSPRCSRPWM